MSKFRDRIGGLISIIIFLSLALITAVFSKYLLNTPYKNYKLEGPVASLYNVVISQTGENGYLQSQLSAKSITYDTKSEAIIVNPVLYLFENDLKPLIATSDIASLNANSDIIKLKNNVKIVRHKTTTNSGFKIIADDTTFNLNLKTASSDGPVEIKKNYYLMQGVGMKINQTERTINILNDVTLIRN